MLLKPWRWPLLIWKTFHHWLEDKPFEQSAALAFYLALSISPLLVILLGVAAAFFSEDAARGEISRQTTQLIGAEGAQAIQALIQNASQPENGGWVATALSVATLLFGASGVFAQLQESLNTVWDVQPKPGRGLLGILRDRFLSFAMVMGIALLLLVSLVMSTVLAFVSRYLTAAGNDVHTLTHTLNVLLTFGVLTTLFALMFKLLPDVEMSWYDVWLGAIVTAVLFSMGKYAIGIYLGQSSMASSYGVAGSFMVLLVWVYYSALILLFGAQMTHTYAILSDRRIQPGDNAEFIADARRRELQPVSAASTT